MVGDIRDDRSNLQLCKYGETMMTQKNEQNNSYSSFNSTDFLNICMNDKSLALSIINTFFEKIDQELFILKNSIKEKDASTTNSIAHKIKGSLGSFSAEKATESAKKIELSAKHENVADWEKILDDFLAEVSHFKKDLCDFKSRLEKELI